jgi:tRNA-intron endonuclease, archaea type
LIKNEYGLPGKFMSENKPEATITEIKATGTLTDKGVIINDRSSMDALSSRGYGIIENDKLTLAFHEALYLLDKEMLTVDDKKDNKVDFQRLLESYKKKNENAWVSYLVYRDLRSRGYVVREGFGEGIAFRIYERGTYGKDTAPYMIMSTQEGQPLPIEELTKALQLCKNQKKELILTVMNRRGETVYYSIGELRIPP